jgi:3-oxoadipate enol-lactonase
LNSTVDAENHTSLRLETAVSHASINGQQIYYEDTGSDLPALVFSHGMLMDHEMFAPQLERLGGQYRIVTWDQRSHGLTVEVTEQHTLWDSAADLIGLLDHLDIERAVLAGMSNGGFVTLRAALGWPTRVAGIILLETQAGAEMAERKANFEQSFDSWATDGPTDELCGGFADIMIGDSVAEAHWIAKWQSRPKSFIVEAAHATLERDDVTGRLSEICCPALVIHGADDKVNDISFARLMADSIPSAQPLIVVPGGHAACMTHPEAVNDAILGFLQTVEYLPPIGLRKAGDHDQDITLTGFR